METIVSTVTNTIEDNPAILTAGDIIRNGGLVAFPTETVYGLGGDALNPNSSKKIYAAKGRPSDNPLIIHICKLEDINRIVSEFPESAKKLAATFWPGPLTMVLPKADVVPSETTGGLNTVAVRMPVDPIALSFIDAAGGYVAAPSANLSGKPSPTSAKYVIEDMQGRIEMILDGGDVEIGLESTIVDLTGEVPMLLRPGFITLEMLKDVLGEVAVDKTILDGDCMDKPKAPGMKYKHYAPKGELTIVTGAEETVLQRINELSKEALKHGEKVGIIGTDETVRNYCGSSIKSVGPRNDEVSIAKHLYRILREFDDEDVTVIYSESFDAGGMGQAIMNRLLKAAGHQVLKV
ncbi:MAG: threonylcarbamoyl-AMP synthase [Lachnospiraceae bacterium]|nr:threonylcarbamoyl-AMP synthase [Lachnospiraceae bacterium]